jgi:hypothetical protein
MAHKHAHRVDRRVMVGLGIPVVLALSGSVGCSARASRSGFDDTGDLNTEPGSGESSSTSSSSSGGVTSAGNGGSLVVGTSKQPDANDEASVCQGGQSASITGKVYDPAGKNPLYNVAVYVPEDALQPLPIGVPIGTDACSCGALFKSRAVTSTTTQIDGSFTLPNVPAGKGVPLVLQVGKWRRSLHVDVASCQDNPQPDKSLTLPGTIPAGDTDDNMPDIAVSTGVADTLECLMMRIGLPASELVAGSSPAGHVHIFSGGEPGGTGKHTIGRPELPPFAGAPTSFTDLWASPTQLMPYDITLLSCEGGETYDANPPALEAYLNAGGRVFASHYHYAWFGGPIASGKWYQPPLPAVYAPPADWGDSLAAWTKDEGNGESPIGGVIDTTLNGSTAPFPKGVALQSWLGDLGALGQDGVPAGQLSIFQSKYNATVTAANTASQPWILAGAKSSLPNATMYFSFDTPVNATTTDGGSPQYCGRVVYSDLHVAGNPETKDEPPTPAGCASGDLSPQEKALEFMLFDLSSCVIPDTMQPPSSLPPTSPR